MPGRWELRSSIDLEALPDFLTLDSPEPSYQTRSTRVWVEDPPLFGRREFAGEYEAQYWRHRGEEVEVLRLRAARGDRFAARRASDLMDQMRAEMVASSPPPDIEQTATGRLMFLDDIQGRSRFSRGVRHSTYDEFARWNVPFTSATTTARTSADDMPDSMAWMAEAYAKFAMPPGLKKEIDKIKTDMEPSDPYLPEKINFERTYIAIDKPNSDVIWYWRLDGRLHPDAVARVVSRYYNSDKAARSLMKNEVGVATLHPDREKCRGSDSTSSYSSGPNSWCGATTRLPVVWWHEGKWWKRVNNSSNMSAFTVIDPNGEFEA